MQSQHTITKSGVHRPGKVQEYRQGGFLISTDKTRLDLDAIHAFLSTCYWASGIPKETVARAIENSLCFGAYKGRKQVGFARVITDYATYAYIGDVFVEPQFRGQGVSKLLMRCIRRHPGLQGLRRWSLITRDAHGLYAQFGFTPLKSPQRHMEVHNPEVYKTAKKPARKRRVE
jgi:GNAT superfamily N-acetyltransferase